MENEAEHLSRHFSAKNLMKLTCMLEPKQIISVF